MSVASGISVASPLKGGVRPLHTGAGSSFFWHKWHAVSGLLLLGGFLLEHLISNFEALGGPAAYVAQVRLLNNLPLVRLLEWGLILAPLGFHALYGLAIVVRGSLTVVDYPWAGNRLYVAQRVSGLVALVYIAQHLVQLRFTGISLATHPEASFHKVQLAIGSPAMVAVYFVGLTAVCFHFAYGGWLFAAKWGIAPGQRARRRVGLVVALLGLGLFVLGVAALVAFTTVPGGVFFST